MTTETMARGSVLPLPVRIEDVTREWLEAALASWTPGMGLKSAEIAEVIPGTCTKVRIRLEPDAAGRAAGIPELVVMKAGFEPHSRAMHTMHGQEVHAYADVAPHSPLRMPKCYFAGYSAEQQQGVVIMEDLKARGVHFLHAQRPQQPGAVARRLSVLAKHHAMTWGGPEIEPGGRFAFAGDYMDGFDHFRGELMTPPVWQSYVDSSRGAAASVRFHSLDWMKDALDRLTRHSRTVPKVLIHGDTHIGNLYIDIDGEPGFFDSLPHIAPPMAEIAYHLTCALDVPDRREHERALVEHYRRELIANGVDAPPLDEMMHQFGLYLATGYLIFLVNASEFQPEAINTAYTARFSAAMLDHDTLGLIAALP
jgi:Ecdysteroid kinase-like family